MKSKISLNNVSVDFPIYNAPSQSIKNKILSKVTGGVIDRESDNYVIVKSLDNLSFEINKGERIGLVGHNGSGKTTLLRVMSNIYEPTSGKIDISGKVTSLINIALGINPEASGRDNIMIRGIMLGLSLDQIKTIEEEVIQFSGLENYIELPFRTYSSGMQLRLAFGVATAINPDILIMDEWISAGDKFFKKTSEKRLKKMINRSEILVITSHSRDLLVNNCDRIIELRQGKIVDDGPAKKVLRKYFIS
ncbi:ABC transporter ATP-binding protein [Methylophilaceae bacterium]|nr:ABC transporter ATP-binding protein [Methylophilaceae bacterium]